MCAIDALGISAMLGQDATVTGLPSAEQGQRAHPEFLGETVSRTRAVGLGEQPLGPLLRDDA
ncbi:hypothetical protein ACFVGY_22635 [Streptomyces sp. NPDC127106]|uniref:hypothetical protein n=1 Tax=Streptomyces sp. NPDC127106 TaxID=3345360 RepID=UPI00363A8960